MANGDTSMRYTEIMFFLLTTAIAEVTAATDLPPMRQVRVEVQLSTGAADDATGPVWAWETVTFGPCTGTPSEARRWTWLSSRDGLAVGVCEADGVLEVRLDGTGTAPRPGVAAVRLTTDDAELELRREAGRWVGDETGVRQVTEAPERTFDASAEARYREVRDTLAELESRADDLDSPEERLAERMERTQSLFDDGADPFLWDAAEFDLLNDWPELDGALGFDGLDAFEGLDDFDGLGLDGF